MLKKNLTIEEKIRELFNVMIKVFYKNEAELVLPFVWNLPVIVLNFFFLYPRLY